MRRLLASAAAVTLATTLLTAPAARAGADAGSGTGGAASAAGYAGASAGQQPAETHLATAAAQLRAARDEQRFAASKLRTAAFDPPAFATTTVSDVPAGPNLLAGTRLTWSRVGATFANEYRNSRLDASRFLVDYHTDGTYLQYQRRSVVKAPNPDKWGVPQASRNGTNFYNATTVSQFALSQYSALVATTQKPSTWYDAADPTSAALVADAGSGEGMLPLRSEKPTSEAQVAARAGFQRAVIRLQMMQSPDGAFRYKYPWTYYLSGQMFQPGWISAMAQGQAISVFTRAYRYDPNPQFLDAARRAYAFLQVPIAQGGPRSDLSDISRSLADHVFYEEYVSDPDGYTLNGFMFTMLGIWDWCQLTAELDLPDAAECAADFEAAMDTLRIVLPFYDMGTFTSYDLGHLTWNRPSPHFAARYHMVHIYLLHALGSITGDPVLAAYERKFASYVQ